MTPEGDRTRVLYVISDLARAGAETQLVELASRIDPARYEREIVLLKRDNDFAEDLQRTGCAVRSLSRRGWWDVAVVWRLAREIRRTRPDLVHSYLLLANLVAVLATRFAGSPPLIVSQRSSYEATVSSPWRRIARWSHRHSQRLLVNSLAALEEEVAAGHPRDHVVYIPNGTAPAEPRGVTRATLGLPNGPLALAVGQLHPLKGHHVLLDAWPAVTRKVSDAHLLILGSGPRHDHLIRQAERLAILPSVTFAGFRAPVTPFLEVADVFVHPSLTEGMPNAILEAMALGRPTVASGVGGVFDLIRDGETGLLVPAGDAPALAAATARLLEDRSLARRLGEAGRRRVLDHFSWKTVLSQTEAVYRAVLGERGNRRANASPAAPKSTGPTVTA